ncbi:glucosamine-6-phosphate deaminase [uncultured Acetobacteroides sp.]|uniref:glucosamine-6-phosphate deaminase n=1 Tax=uncultured Acetobacteroides sp. TaxID=1760811 RepID=UPI0029F48474|nr:glucosamine-6-phosphate deaminase [uncultured Acetobacteroides sp.]
MNKTDEVIQKYYNPFEYASPFRNGAEPESIRERYERIPTAIYPTASEAVKIVAQEVADLIKSRAQKGEMCVLGLATGSSPIPFYKELVRMHKEEGLSFKNVVTFNLDEYYPMEPTAKQSYVRFMNENLFDHIDILPENVNIPDGTLPVDKATDFCKGYDAKIDSCGGLDIQILGIGRTGHIGFNEPGSLLNSPTRMVSLDPLTRFDAASDFGGEENVPRKAITMGVASIMKAKKIVLFAWGDAKAEIIKKAVEGPVSEQIPTTFLQLHQNVNILCDFGAAMELTRVKHPWLVGSCTWHPRLIRKAVVWLCQELGKPILKLTDADYREHGLSELLEEYGYASTVNIKVFNDLQHTISGWPGGKPNSDDATRPERALPFPKKVVIFSPHPDDDVISMGGTFSRLINQGHDVHVAYHVSGNIAVFDDYALRFLDFLRDVQHIYDIKDFDANSVYTNAQSIIATKKPGDADPDALKRLKGAIRRGEARAACRYLGLDEEHVHFMDLPFYETGKVKKSPKTQADVDIVKNLLQELQPHQIYAAGDLADPHGTHRVCIETVIEACKQLKHEAWFKDCRIWLYRGAWMEWDLDMVDMAVPLSPEEVKIKRLAIYRHQSQKDMVPFPGKDPREFWQRSEDRNHATAELYDKLGMAEYQAIECFVRYDHFI